jgi:hypothetical protein|tara:strand:- start:1903 stop:2184 length:282 start_codon:yes stop_codon:yes gene_type:complete
MKLVKVIWLDTNETSNSGWCTTEEAKQARPCKIASVGYIVNETSEFITIAADIDANKLEEEQDDLLGRVQCFPIGCVISIIDYKEENERESIN